jgi:hypothetical protein
MKLTIELLAFQPVIYSVDTMRNDKDWAFLSFGQKITHGAIQRAGHFYGFAAASDERE